VIAVAAIVHFRSLEPQTPYPFHAQGRAAFDQIENPGADVVSRSILRPLFGSPTDVHWMPGSGRTLPQRVHRPSGLLGKYFLQRDQDRG